MSVNQTAISIPVKNQKGVSSSKPIVYLSSHLLCDNKKSSSFDFFVQLITTLSNKLHTAGFDLIVKVPTDDIALHQSEILEHLYSNKDRYGVVIIAPISTKEICKKLSDLLKDHNEFTNLPIITIDKVLSKNVNKLKLPYVSADWKKGGEIAAKRFSDYFALMFNKEKKRKILILKGKEGSAPRISGFKQFSKDHNDIFNITISKELDFSRETARDYIYNLKTINEFDGIFSCNDEMALGAREALQKLKSENKITNTIKIVGFDGINETIRHLNDETEEFLLDSVDVKISDQIDTLVSFLKVAQSNPEELLKRKKFKKLHPVSTKRKIT